MDIEIEKDDFKQKAKLQRQKKRETFIKEAEELEKKHFHDMGEVSKELRGFPDALDALAALGEQRFTQAMAEMRRDDLHSHYHDIIVSFSHGIGPREDIPTMCVSMDRSGRETKLNLFYSPHFVVTVAGLPERTFRNNHLFSMLDDAAEKSATLKTCFDGLAEKGRNQDHFESMKGVVIHESFHLMLRHLQRSLKTTETLRHELRDIKKSGSRNQLFDKSMELIVYNMVNNVATDYVINSDPMLQAVLPQCGVFMPDEFDGLGSDEIHSVLMQRHTPDFRKFTEEVRKVLTSNTKEIPVKDIVDRIVKESKYEHTAKDVFSHNLIETLLGEILRRHMIDQLKGKKVNVRIVDGQDGYGGSPQAQTKDGKAQVPDVPNEITVSDGGGGSGLPGGGPLDMEIGDVKDERTARSKKQKNDNSDNDGLKVPLGGEPDGKEKEQKDKNQKGQDGGKNRGSGKSQSEMKKDDYGEDSREGTDKGAGGQGRVRNTSCYDQEAERSKQRAKDKSKGRESGGEFAGAIIIDMDDGDTHEKTIQDIKSVDGTLMGNANGLERLMAATKAAVEKANPGSNSRGHGSVFDAAYSILNEIRMSRVDYKNIIFNFFRKIKIAKERELTKKRFTRRYGNQNEFSRFNRLNTPGSRIKRVPEPMLVCDVSGSVSNFQKTVFLGGIKGIYRALDAKELWVIQADADILGKQTGPSHINKEVKVNVRDIAPDKFAWALGGGTSFREPLLRADHLFRTGKISGCVYFTDGYGTADVGEDQGVKLRVPVIWVIPVEQSIEEIGDLYIKSMSRCSVQTRIIAIRKDELTKEKAK